MKAYVCLTIAAALEPLLHPSHEHGSRIAAIVPQDEYTSVYYTKDTVVQASASQDDLEWKDPIPTGIQEHVCGGMIDIDGSVIPGAEEGTEVLFYMVKRGNVTSVDLETLDVWRVYGKIRAPGTSEFVSLEEGYLTELTTAVGHVVDTCTGVLHHETFYLLVHSYSGVLSIIELTKHFGFQVVGSVVYPEEYLLPQLLPVGDKWVFLATSEEGPLAALGDFDGENFTPVDFETPTRDPVKRDVAPSVPLDSGDLREIHGFVRDGETYVVGRVASSDEGVEQWTFPRRLEVVEEEGISTLRMEFTDGLEGVGQCGMASETSRPMVSSDKVILLLDEIDCGVRIDGFVHPLLDITLRATALTGDMALSVVNMAGEAVTFMIHGEENTVSMSRPDGWGPKAIFETGRSPSESDLSLRIILDTSMLEMTMDHGRVFMTTPIAPQVPFDKVIMTVSGSLNLEEFIVRYLEPVFEAAEVGSEGPTEDLSTTSEGLGFVSSLGLLAFAFLLA